MASWPGLNRRIGLVWFGSVRFCLVGSSWPSVLVFALPCVCHFGNCADCTVAGRAASVCFNFSYRQAAALCFPPTHAHFVLAKAPFSLPSTWELSCFCLNSPVPYNFNCTMAGPFVFQLQFF